jgi:hypothetical protein
MDQGIRVQLIGHLVFIVDRRMNHSTVIHPAPKYALIKDLLSPERSIYRYRVNYFRSSSPLAETPCLIWQDSVRYQAPIFCLDMHG